MVNVFSTPKKKDEIIEEGKQTIKQDFVPAKTSEQPATILQKLKLEEAQLAEEKRNLVQIKEQLQKKIKDQIENSKTNLQKLKAEVNELKTECTELNFTLQNEILAE